MGDVRDRESSKPILVALLEHLITIKASPNDAATNRPVDARNTAGTSP
jgi:hypothetical protein